MNIYILRHGAALERDEWDPREDSKRPLTPEGETQVRKVGEAMKKMDLQIDLVVSSPLERARRTAEIVAEELGLEKRLTYSAELQSDGEPKKLIREINKRRPAPENLLLVGHEPYLGNLISMLATGKNKMEIDFKKAGLAKLAAEKLEYDRCAILVWLLTPKQMELMV